MNPTTEILKRINKSSADHKDGVFTRLYRYLLREERIRADILKQLQAAPQAEAVTARIREVKEEAQLIKAALAEYESK